MSPRVTMRDVAEASGVSSMTVSRALRGDETVSAKTRARIQETADRLGYVYDGTAQAFRTQKSGFVALTLPSINNANFAETYLALMEAMGAAGRQLLLGATNYRIAREEELVRQLLARNPEALVMTGGHHTEATRALVASRGLPVVEIWDLPVAPLGHVVGFSTADAMRKILFHLMDSGRRNLAFVGASDDSDWRGADRRQAIVEAAAAAGLPPVVALDAGPAPMTMRQGADLVARLGRDLLTFDALVCVSDPVAFGVVSECRRRGISVPGDLAVTGFGCFDLALVADPQITTVDVNAWRIGAETADVLTALLEGRSAVPQINVGSRLVPGGTT